MTEDDILDLLEELASRLLRELAGYEAPRPFPRMTCADAMARYGTDRPDLRFGFEIRAFSETVAGGGTIRGFLAEGGGVLSRKSLSELEDHARENGAKGLLWYEREPDGLAGPTAKFLSEVEKAALVDTFGAGTGDLLLLVADVPAVAAKALGAVRLAAARVLDRIPSGAWEPLFVTHFPLVEWNEAEQRFDALHHAFTAPYEEDLPLLSFDPGAVRARAYDLVLNGTELGGGSIRIHREEVQVAVLESIGIDPAAGRRKVGFLLEALRHGAPPHGGFALGFDRLVAMLSGGDPQIREFIAFPKTTSASCPLTDAPAPVDEAQLAELRLRLLEE